MTFGMCGNCLQRTFPWDMSNLGHFCLPQCALCGWVDVLSWGLIYMKVVPVVALG